MGNGYGSECHLLRYLGRHRQELNRRVLKVVGGEAVEWLDFHFDPNRQWPDAEWKGLDFIDDESVQDRWRAFWPQAAGIHNWDAVAKLRRAGSEEWLLVEAKAHVGEMTSSSAARSKASREQIGRALQETKDKLGVTGASWTSPYYQYCNRLATLYFLDREHIPARLLFLYFTGDKSGHGRECPSNARGWQQALESLERTIGLPPGHLLEDRIHRLFLHVYLPEPGDQPEPVPAPPSPSGPTPPQFQTSKARRIQDAVEEWDRIRGSWPPATGTSPEYRPINVKGWPDSVHYEFMARKGTVTAEIHLQRGEIPPRRIAPVVDLLKSLIVEIKLKLSPVEVVDDDPRPRDFLRIQVVNPAGEPASNAAHLMERLIELTFDKTDADIRRLGL